MSRHLLELTRHWQVRADPDDRGLAERWWQTPPSDGWQPTRTGVAWQHVLGEYYHGIAWYRRRARLPGKWTEGDARLWLSFESVATDCRVWIGSEEVGAHVGDYVPFRFEITDVVRAADRRKGGTSVDLCIRVDEIEGRRPERVGEDPWIGHITKGFHDVLSLQHGGIWQPVAIRRTGCLAIRPNGVRVRSDPQTGGVRVRVELERATSGGMARVVVRRDGEACSVRGNRRCHIDQGACHVELAFDVEDVLLWSPENPVLHELDVQVYDRVGSHPRVSDRLTVPFAFRSIETSGRQIHLNGKPIVLRGVLDWGHEPELIAPSPSRLQVRERLEQIRARGFNLLCLCMWYPPSYLYQIAAEVGIMLWQVHPVWKSDMDAVNRSEYQRLYESFFRRDRTHPAVVMVSGSCEHECFDRELGAWWWTRAREELSCLLQVQTGFLDWSAESDFNDEHTYESSGRWAPYLEDVGARLEAGPVRPFVMGETMVGTSWPDPADGQWWAPRTGAACRELLDEWTNTEGARNPVADADYLHVLFRRFQYEVFRQGETHAGIVMNHLRDVPLCQCGFMDDHERWRFKPEQFSSWFADTVLLLVMPDQRRGFAAGASVPTQIVVSSFDSAGIDGELVVTVRRREVLRTEVRCRTGELIRRSFVIRMPATECATPITVRAELPGAPTNEWTLWVFPMSDTVAHRYVGQPFTPAERELEWEERSYSSGWATPIRSWRRRLPDTEALLAQAPSFDGVPPSDARVVVTHRLTPEIRGWIEAGGSAVLLASQARDGWGTKFRQMFGFLPLIAERGPFSAGDGEWILDLLCHDLTRTMTRPIPASEGADPLIRLVYTHDQEEPELMDLLCVTGIGRGRLVVSALDHHDDAGRYILSRLVGWLDSPAERAM